MSDIRKALIGLGWVGLIMAIVLVIIGGATDNDALRFRATSNGFLSMAGLMLLRATEGEKHG